jgi:hypothetical protein
MGTSSYQFSAIDMAFWQAFWYRNIKRSHFIASFKEAVYKVLAKKTRSSGN